MTRIVSPVPSKPCVRPHVVRRLSQMVALKRMQHLRVAGSAFLTQGQVVYCGHDAHIAETYKGPCMLPPSPALYVCGTDIKVSCLLPMDLSLCVCGSALRSLLRRL